MTKNARRFRCTVISESTILEAAETMESIAQLAEMEVRRETRVNRDLFQQVSNEVTARLTDEVPVPDIHSISAVVRSVFEKYFGERIQVDVEEVPATGGKVGVSARSTEQLIH